MKVNITARHLELTPALRNYAEKKLLQVKKYVEKVTTAHIILNVEKDRHIAEIVLGLSKSSLTAKAVAGDMYGAIDLVMDKLVKQLRKHMDKVKEHKDLPYTVVANMVKNEAETIGENSSLIEPQLEEVKEIDLRTQTVAEALNSLEEKELSFWPFKNSRDGSVCIVYKRESGIKGMLVVS